MSRQPLTPGELASRVNIVAPAADIARAKEKAALAGMSVSEWTRQCWTECAPRITDAAEAHPTGPASGSPR